ncbi:hypothetical protein Bbelb_365870 [Branchiostoma belcheri]|nr:hypothetical protein Bbelb_365870 [Branchiostoma belcheri]
MAEGITKTDVTPRVNADDVDKGIRSDIYRAGCNPSKPDTDKTVEDDTDVEPHPVKSGGQNPTNMPNVPQQASCKSTGIWIAVLIGAILAMTLLIVGIWLYVKQPTQAVEDITYTPDQPAVDTTYTPGGTTNMPAHSTILPPGTTRLEREVSTNGVTVPATAIQKGPVSPKRKWRDDLRCGSRYPAENGQPAECDPEGVIPCCSTGHWCGKTAEHCNCQGCVNYRKNKKTGL